MDELRELVASNGLVFELAGLFVAAVLLVTLVTIEVRRAGPVTGPGTGQRAGPAIFSRREGRVLVAVMWVSCVLLFLPRVLELLA
jgi:pyruvate/2-oxoacid:ferredoxin oxidoreductase alpha subunit